VSTWSGFAYVAFVTDAYARRILGWRVASTMTTAIVLDGIEQAIWTRQREGMLDLKDVVHHTDRGSQYTSIRFTERLAEAGIQPSVGAVGSSYDKGLASQCTSWRGLGGNSFSQRAALSCGEAGIAGNGWFVEPFILCRLPCGS